MRMPTLFAATVLLAQTPGVGPFIKSAPAREFAALKIYDAHGSPVRQAREGWAGARRRVASDPEWAAWLKQRRTEVDDWTATRRDHVEWVAGWWHDFVSPKDGSFLRWTPDEPGEWTLSSPSDPKVKLTPKLHGAWVFGFRSRHTDKVFEAARLFRLTGDRKYGDWAASQIDFYAENYLNWPIQTSKSKSRLMHQSLDDANVLIRLVNAARLLDAEEQRRARWIDKLFRPEAELLDETFQRIHNIACWQRSAMAQAAIYDRDEALWKRAIDGPFGIRKQVEFGVTSDYLWFEQSLLYNNYVVSAMLPLYTLASLEGRAGELAHEMRVIENLMLAPIMLRFPDGRLPNPADATGGVQRAPNEPFLATAYRLFPTQLGLLYAAKLRSWDTLLDPPERVTAQPKLPEVTSRSLLSSRMAVLRQGQWQVFFHYGQLDQSHAQAEALNFEAYYGDTDITHDPGTVGYGSPLHQGFYRTPAAHNVPVVNGQGQDKWQPGELVSFAPHRVVARQPRYRPGVSVTRELRIEGAKLIDEVTVATAEAGRIGVILHLQGRIRRPQGGTDVEPPMPYWENARRFEFKRRAALEARFAGRTVRVTVATAGPFALILAQSPDMPPDKRDSLYVETDAAHATFRTTIEPQ